MIELVIHQPGKPDRRMVLKGGAYGIGRHEHNDIVLDDKEVSRKHARLLVDGEAVLVEDLGSGNGTFVDDAEIQKKVLGLGDVIEILPFTLELRHAEPPPAPKVWRLRVTDGEDAGRTVALEEGDVVTIGRDASQILQLSDHGASREHAVVKPWRDGWSVRDLDSANGVLVNDQLIAEAPLRPGDRILIGNTELVLEHVEVAPPAPPPAPEPPPASVGTDADLLLEDDEPPTDVGETVSAGPPRVERVRVAPAAERAARQAPAPAPAPAPVAPPAPAPVAAPAVPAPPAVAAPAQGGGFPLWMAALALFLVIGTLFVGVLGFALAQQAGMF